MPSLPVRTPLPAPRTARPHHADDRSYRRALLTIGLAAASWGSAGAAAALLHRISGLGPIAVSCWRFALGAALLTAARPLIRRASPRAASRVRPGPRPRLLPLLGTGLLMATFQTCYLASVDLAGLALGTTATLGAAPVLTTIAARFLFGERLGRRGATTVALAVTGLALLAFGSTSGGDGSHSASAAANASASVSGPHPVLGLLCALGSAAGSAAINLLGQAQARDGRTGDPYDRALCGFAVGAVCLLPLAAATGPLLPRAHHLATAAALLGYLGAVPTALAYALFFAAIGTVRATAVSVVMMLEPVAALLLAVTLLGEHLTLAAAVGTATLLAAVTLLSECPQPEHPQPRLTSD
ncbi:EamA family transporter [Streptacidiphilus cavernicola]|uniref:EamA family transporter n=1 Tax=Streptacidiphilus cavernicola TaxID=3342716 RepID=A0ABV6VRJ7_9ACTN